MRILILGGDGMLGHQLLKSYQQRHEVKVTLRGDISKYSKFGLFNKNNSLDNVDVFSFSKVVQAIRHYQPEVVINAVGIVKQRSRANESIPSIEINSLLPHRLAVLCGDIGSRLIHLSTDCVFSGGGGNYLENDFSDAVDLYGRSKYLGEVGYDGCLTLRTSIIGSEISRHTGLFDWFKSQTGTVSGYTNAIFSGFTTIEMARIIENMIVKHEGASGIYHVSSSPISKYDLLLLIKNKFNLDISVVPNSDLKCNRSLDSTLFQNKFNYSPPTWASMIDELDGL